MNINKRIFLLLSMIIVETYVLSQGDCSDLLNQLKNNIERRVKLNEDHLLIKQQMMLLRNSPWWRLDNKITAYCIKETDDRLLMLFEKESQQQRKQCDKIINQLYAEGCLCEKNISSSEQEVIEILVSGIFRKTKS